MVRAARISAMSLAAVGPRGPGACVALALVGSRRFRGGLFLATVALVLAVGLSFRLPDLERPGRNYDEGVYLQSLLLMRHGYLPVRDIPATQGPLHLYVAYPPYALGEYTLEAARLGAVGASLLAILGLAWAGAATIGRVGGVAAALALALSPAFLNVSRQALPEAPALAFTILAVGAAGKAWTTDRDRWRLAAGALFAAACLVKPVVAPAGLAVVVLGFTPRSWRASVLVPAIAALVGLGALLGVGIGPALDQVIGWRLEGEQVDPSLETIRHNAELLVDRLLLPEQPALYALAFVGAVLLARSRSRFGLAITGWFVGQLGLLLLYVNLSSHLGVTLLPPLALLFGAAATAAWRAIATLPRPTLRGGIALAAALWYLAVIPLLVERNHRIVEGQASTDASLGQTERNVVRTIERLTDEDDWVITDGPYLAFLADRKVPPPLVDPSDARIDAGATTGKQVVDVLRRYDADTVVLWTGKLSRLGPFVATLRGEYILIQDHGTGNDDLPRLVYRDPNDTD